MCAHTTPIPRLFPSLMTLRGLLIGLSLFFYAQLKYERDFPPYVFIIQAGVLVTLSSWAFWKLMRREPLVRSPLAFPFIGMLVAATLATYWSVDPRRSVDGLLVILVFTLAFFLFSDLLQKGWPPATFTTALLWFASMAVVLGTWNIGVDHWQTWQRRVPGYPVFLFEYRLFGVFDHPNFLAPLITLALPFAILQLERSRTWRARIGWGLWIWAYETVLFFTRSRGGWFAALVGATVIVFWLLIEPGLPHRVGLRQWWRRAWKVLLGGTLAFGWFVLLWRLPDIQALIEARTTTIQSTFSTNSSATIAGTLQHHRMALWRLAWEQFLAHPLTGSGPLTFAHAYVNHMASVRIWVPAHAHSLYFEMLATQGMVGCSALLWLLAAGLRVCGQGLWLACKRISQTAPPQDPTLWSESPPSCSEHGRLLWGVCAALASYLTHSLVDVVGKLASNDLVAVMLVTIGVWAAEALRKCQQAQQAVPTVQPEQPLLARWTLGTVILIPGLVFILIRQGMGLVAMHEAIDAAVQGNWSRAAQAMDEAVSIDPQFSFYWGQRGYAYSVLAAPLDGEDDPFARARAIESYAIAIETAPAYVPHLLNLAALLEQEGLPDAAKQKLEQAVVLPQAVYWALPSFLLAEVYGREGNEPSMRQSIHEALAREVHAAEMAACRRMPQCQTIARTLPLSPTVSRTYAIHRQVSVLLQRGYPRKALALLDTIPLSDPEPFPWFDRARAHLALGEQAQAQYAFGAGHMLWHDNPYTSAAATIAAITRAALLRAQNEHEAAIHALESAVLPRVVGDGYSYSVFGRVGLPGVLQPRLDLLQRTADDLAIYRQLERWYRERGMEQRANWARTHANLLASWLRQ